MGESEEANEFREYLTEFGPRGFASLENDRKTLNQKGTDGKVAKKALELGWAEVMKVASPARAGTLLGL